MSSPIANAFIQAASSLAQPAQRVSFTVDIAGQDLTASISESLIELDYIENFAPDSAEQIADTLTISIADPTGFFRHQFNFKPYISKLT